MHGYAIFFLDSCSFPNTKKLLTVSDPVFKKNLTQVKTTLITVSDATSHWHSTAMLSTAFEHG